jgi:hypothetical protein
MAQIGAVAPKKKKRRRIENYGRSHSSFVAFSRAGFPHSFRDNTSSSSVPSMPSNLIVRYYFTVRNCISYGIVKALINKPIIKINLKFLQFLASISYQSVKEKVAMSARKWSCLRFPVQI